VADGSTTTHQYDLQGRETSTTLGMQPASAVKRNTLGWELARTDFDGVITRTSYDETGRVTSVDRGGQRAEYAFGPYGDLLGYVGPDGTSAEWQYDTFGRQTFERQASAGLDVKRVATAFDAAGRLPALARR